MLEPVIEVRDLVHKFGERTVLNGISFTVEKGDTMIIVGSSGCGKRYSAAPYHWITSTHQGFDQNFRRGDDGDVGERTG